MRGALLMALIYSLSAQAYMSPDQVKKQFKSPGHIPQGLKPKMYHKLKEVLPEKQLQKLKKQKEEGHAPEPKKISFMDFLFPSAHAGGKKKPEPVEPPPAPVPVVSPSPLPPDAKRPMGVDLRQYDSYIRSQWDGTCTSHGLIASMENILNRKNIGVKTLSTRYFWNQYRQYSAVAAIAAATKNKQVYERYWPQNSTQPVYTDVSALASVKMVKATYLDDSVDDAIGALAHGHPVYVAMSVPRDMASCRATIRPTSGVTNGGHAIAITGYQYESSVEGGGYFIIKNSWGTDCGDKGYQYMPFSLCSKPGMYCVFWDVENVIDLR
jgi:hypothetical protein